jgi:hypothetical protein
VSERRSVTRILLALALAGCSSSKGKKPEGTPTDPVEVCEKLADVCRLDGAKLGVCIEAPKCEGPAPCFTCVSQH